MKRRHHNNHALTSTKRGKRKREVARIAKRLNIPQRPKAKQDVLLERPEEDPGYGWGV